MKPKLTKHKRDEHFAYISVCSCSCSHVDEDEYLDALFKAMHVENSDTNYRRTVRRQSCMCCCRFRTNIFFFCRVFSSTAHVLLLPFHYHWKQMQMTRPRNGLHLLLLPESHDACHFIIRSFSPHLPVPLANTHYRDLYRVRSNLHDSFTDSNFFVKLYVCPLR